MPQQNGEDGERLAAVQRLKRDFFLPPLDDNRYQIEKIIGEGSYGVVCSAMDTQSNERVAVKRIMKVFDQVPEAVRILRELKFLRVLRSHENIITTRDVLLPSNRDNFNDVFVVFDLMPADLNRVMRSEISLSAEHIRWLIYQLLRGVSYLHRAKVFHRDLKPSNILINAECDLVICDFGLARAILDPIADQPGAIFWTDYVATRWYRAPELIMCSSSRYSTAIDIWSCGVIFAEMLNGGKPLFPGLNATHQLELITNRIGLPSTQAIQSVQDPTIKTFLEKLNDNWQDPQNPRQPLRFNDVLPHVDPLALSFLESLLQIDPNKRPSAEQALQHPYFSDLQHDTSRDEEPPQVSTDEFLFESKTLNQQEIREMFLDEILKYHPEKRHLFAQQRQQQEQEAMQNHHLHLHQHPQQQLQQRYHHLNQSYPHEAGQTFQSQQQQHHHYQQQQPQAQYLRDSQGMAQRAQYHGTDGMEGNEVQGNQHHAGYDTNQASRFRSHLMHIQNPNVGRTDPRYHQSLPPQSFQSFREAHPNAQLHYLQNPTANGVLAPQAPPQPPPPSSYYPPHLQQEHQQQLVRRQREIYAQNLQQATEDMNVQYMGMPSNVSDSNEADSANVGTTSRHHSTVLPYDGNTQRVSETVDSMPDVQPSNASS